MKLKVEFESSNEIEMFLKSEVYQKLMQSCRCTSQNTAGPSLNAVNPELMVKKEHVITGMDMPIAADLLKDWPQGKPLPPIDIDDLINANVSGSADEVPNLPMSSGAPEGIKTERDALKARLQELGEDASSSKASNETLKKKIKKLEEIKANEAHQAKSGPQSPSDFFSPAAPVAESPLKISVDLVRALGRDCLQDLGSDLVYKVMEKFGQSKQLETINKNGKLEDTYHMLRLFLNAKAYGEKFGPDKLVEKLKTSAQVDNLWGVLPHLSISITESMKAEL